MKTLLRFSTVIFIFMAAQMIAAQTTAFTYQGKLTDGGNPANGTYQMEFRLTQEANGTTQVGDVISIPGVSVSQGVFTVTLNFTGSTNLWDGGNRFLEVKVRRSDTESFTMLLPRQQVLSVPYAIKSKAADEATNAANAGQLGNVNADRFVRSDANGNVAIGTTPNGSKLTVAGVIESTTGGFKFPDGTTQTSAGLTSIVTNSTLSGNGTSNSPLGISSPVTIRDADRPTRQAINSGFPFVVPAGKILVIEYITATSNSVADSVSLPVADVMDFSVPGGVVLHRIPPRTWVQLAGAQREWVYSETVRIYARSGADIALLSPVTLSHRRFSGYLVDNP